MNSKELNDYFFEWSLQLKQAVEEMLDTKFRLKYPYEDMEIFECMVDEVKRLDKVMDFYDILVEVSDEKLLECINGDTDDLKSILYDFLDYYMDVPLEIKLNKEKIVENFMKKINGEIENE